MSENSNPGSKALRAILPIGALAIGVGTLIALKMSKEEPQKKAREDRGRLIEIMVARPGNHPVEVIAKGRVMPARSVVAQPEVGGRVVWQHKELVPGGRLKKGDRLIRIDVRDYELAVEQQKAAVDRARLEVDVEKGRKKVAEREWELLGDDGSGADEASRDLALREPQMRTAKVGLAAAESGLDRAKLNVSRAMVRVPFNCFVQSENTEVGQLVGPQTPLATLIGTDHFWVQVSVPVENLTWVKVPGFNAKVGEGSEAQVTQEIGNERVERNGRVIRLLGDLDPMGGMARVLVEIEDPLGVNTEGALPLLLGAYVSVQLAAGEVDGVFEIPRTALRDGDRVYVMDADGFLAERPVTIVWRFPDRVLVNSGIETGDRVITSRLADAVPGMKLRVNEPTPDTEAGQAIRAESR